MDDFAINTEKLTKYYKKQRGIVELSLSVRTGEVFGFLGPNGAGKTTTIRLLLGLLRPTDGSASVFDFDTVKDSVEIRHRCGYLPGELVLYENMTGTNLLQYMASLRGGVSLEFAEELAERLDCDLSRPIRTLSRGNKQKIGLVQALMHQPELLVLDEPTSGLDPLVQHEFYKIIAEASAAGQTVFLSSHNLPEVERVCHRAGIIREGRLIAIEEIASLKERALRRLEIHFEGAVEKSAFRVVPGIRNLQWENSIMRCEIMGSLDPLIKTLAQYNVTNLISHEPHLDEIFMAFYGEGSEKDVN
jgi:ABC-2 type transport system ATP-binding protein